MARRLPYWHLTALAAATVLCAASGFAADPAVQEKITYQATLLDASGNPLYPATTQTFTVIIQAKDSNNAYRLKWRKSSVKGYVNAQGLATLDLQGTSENRAEPSGTDYLSLKEAFGEADPAYISIAVGSSTLIDKKRLASAPYAIVAQEISPAILAAQAGRLTDFPAVTAWQSDGTVPLSRSDDGSGTMKITGFKLRGPSGGGAARGNLLRLRFHALHYLNFCDEPVAYVGNFEITDQQDPKNPVPFSPAPVQQNLHHFLSNGCETHVWNPSVNISTDATYIDCNCVGNKEAELLSSYMPFFSMLGSEGLEIILFRSMENTGTGMRWYLERKQFDTPSKSASAPYVYLNMLFPSCLDMEWIGYDPAPVDRTVDITVHLAAVRYGSAQNISIIQPSLTAEEILQPIQNEVLRTDAPTPRFTCDKVRGPWPLTVQFKDLSDPGTGSGMAYHWDFGDDLPASPDYVDENGIGFSPSTSTAKDPIHVYRTPGKFAVTLHVTSTDGENTLTVPEYIYVEDLK